MLRGFDWSDSVIDEARRTAPHHDVSLFQAHPPDGIRALFSAPQEHGWHAQRYGHYRRPGVVLVAILMEAELCARFVAIDQAGIGIVSFKSAFGRGSGSQIKESRRHRGPRFLRLRIHRIIAVTSAVRYPADAATVGHRDRHGMAAGGHQMTEWSRMRDLPGLFDQSRRFRKSERAQQDGAFFQRLARRRMISKKRPHSYCHSERSCVGARVRNFGRTTINNSTSTAPRVQ